MHSEIVNALVTHTFILLSLLGPFIDNIVGTNQLVKSVYYPNVGTLGFHKEIIILIRNHTVVDFYIELLMLQLNS